MNIYEVLIPVFYYLLPSFLLFYMAMDVYFRNRHKVEHLLAAAIILSYTLLFLSEYVRYLLPIEYSPFMVTFIMGNIGIIMPSLVFHFIIKVIHLEHRMPAKLYPWILYVPTMIVPLTIFSGENIINSQQFVQRGIWKVPMYNASYYTTVSISSIFLIFLLYILWKARKRAHSETQKSVVQLLLVAVLCVTLWTVLFGFVEFEASIPPHPYIYAGILWSVFLLRAMKKYDFLSSYHQRYEKLFTINPMMVLLLDEKGRTKEANPSARNLFASTTIDDSMHFDELIDADEREEWKKVFVNSIHHQSRIEQREFRLKLPGQDCIVMIDGDYIEVDDRPHLLLIIRDITAEKQYAEKIHHMAYHDPLTKLPNRRSFKEKVDQYTTPNEDNQHALPFAIALIDLDRFKEVNDQYGHHIGDEFLKHVASLLKQMVPEDGMAARLAGDEFVLFLPIHEEEKLTEFAEAVMEQFRKNWFQADRISIPVQASVGLSLCPIHGSNYDQLLNHADKSLYTVKSSGRNMYHIRWE
ncbi:diguanylate cyclase [Halobacillus fulvus]|nr:diguanylate cyclase [Halobacillus fulvus]